MSVGIGDGEEALVRSRHIGVGHAEHLAPLVAEMLEEKGLTPADIGRVCATVGPGSFMGTRVGLSFASGFALPRSLPTLPVTTLEALWFSAPEDAMGAVLIDARREQVYGQIFTPLGGAPFLLDIEEARRATEDVV
ncbi:MAG: tRNA (adenosine(37)-N6)-threonylcarbamoyltransferase complex dimerization subunit type 1 TsaB, partial [Pseudomonadota bacterium]